MNKSYISHVIISFGIIALAIVLGHIRSSGPVSGDITPANIFPDARNMSYVVGGETFYLVDGKAEKEYVPGSTTKNTLYLFGEPTYGDLDGDGDTDAAVLLVNNPGGSGTFFYAALIVNDGMQTYHATSAMLLGDRIAPQTVEIHDGRAVYNFAVRKGNEPMNTQPSVGKSVWVNYDRKTGEIGEWVKGFEGESVMPR